ncbi:hypothetical protein HK405_006136 [Cladochytrium tenue]|nr:hypothetical protein HK405_006136 [Cladochytrium tenue]
MTALPPPTPPARLPTYFLAHGNVQWLASPTASGPRFLACLGRRILQAWPAAARPRAVLIVSAHWETSPDLRVTSVQKHKLLYDYYGFPDKFYNIKYPVDGEPEVAAETARLLAAAGFTVADETERGLDHGAFGPLLYMFPNQELPVVQLSLPNTGQPDDYFRMGAALAPLRDRGVLILGTGYVTHNLMAFRASYYSAGRGGADHGSSPSQPPDWAADFVSCVRAAVGTGADAGDDVSGTSSTSASAASGIEVRRRALAATFQAPTFKMAAPSPEHYAPVLVAGGAGGADAGVLINEGWDSMTFTLCEDSYRFGAEPVAVGAPRDAPDAFAADEA